MKPDLPDYKKVTKSLGHRPERTEKTFLLKLGYWAAMRQKPSPHSGDRKKISKRYFYSVTKGGECFLGRDGINLCFQYYLCILHYRMINNTILTALGEELGFFILYFISLELPQVPMKLE